MAVNLSIQARQQMAALDQHLRFNKLYDKATDTLTLSFDDVLSYSQDLYERLTQQPLVYLSALQAYVRDTVAPRAQLVLQGDPIGQRMATPRELSAAQLCQMFKVTGIVTRTQQPAPSLRTLVSYDAEQRAHLQARYEDPLLTLNPSVFAQFVPRDDAGARQYGLSDFVTVQRVTVQDCPEHVPQGRIPKSVLVVLTERLVDRCKSGDRVEAVGTLLPLPGERGQQAGVYLLATAVRAVAKNKTLPRAPRAAEAEFAAFLEQCQAQAVGARSPSAPALQLLAASLSPSIYGHELIKRAVVLQLLGGIARDPGQTAVRGDINVLLIGSPGCGKSQILRAAMNLTPIAMSASGRGASGAGLTAAVVIEKSGQRTLQAGAFVLADGGLLCIDEFDKLQQYDRAAIHEAMEQQTVSISKAGIHATLNARCAVLAAANYVYGAFNHEKSVSENINMPDSLLSRFDLIFLVNDSRDFDVQVARHVLENHASASAQPPAQPQAAPRQPRARQGDAHMFSQIGVENFLIYNQEQHEPLLRQFRKLVRDADAVRPQRFLLAGGFLGGLLRFCRARSAERPHLTPEAVRAVAEFYGRLRRREARGLLVTARALESMVRLATALAKLSWPLRDVCRADVVEAYVLVRHSLFGEPEEEIRRGAQAAAGPARAADADLRYDLFGQALSEAIERLGGGSAPLPALRRELARWMEERRELGQAPFTEAEVAAFLARVAEGEAGVVVEGDVVYF